MTLRASKDGERLWEVKAKEADVRIDPKGDKANMNGVSATLYEDGLPAMTLTANEGTADEATGHLTLKGAVKAVSHDGRTSLRCDRIAWTRDERVLVAEGRVTGVTAGIEVGPADLVRARFESKDKKMNTTTAALALVSLLAQGKVITYKDGAGNMHVTAKKFQIMREGETENYRFVGTGPFVAKWLKQHFEVSGNKLEGVITPVNKSYELQHGTFTGNIEAHYRDPRGNNLMDVTGVSTWTIRRSEDGALWRYSGDGAPFVATFSGPGAVVTGRHIEGTADRAVGVTRPEWRTATFTGGVTTVITQDGGKTHITVTSSTVTLNRATSTAVMSGGVVASGKHAALGPEGGEFTAGKVTIVFDQAMKKVKSLTGESE